MKVVITVNNFHPDRWYLEHYLARELTRLGHEVHVFTFTSGFDHHDKSAGFDFKVHRLPHMVTFGSYKIPSPRAILYVVRFLRKEMPDIIHCQPLFSPLSLLFFFCQTIGSHELVGSLITGTYSIMSIPSIFKYSITKIVTEKFIQRKSKLVFVKSKSLKRVLQRIFDLEEKKICIVPLGADSEVFSHNEHIRHDTRMKLGIKLEDVVVIISGTLLPSKRIHEPIRALAPIIKEKGNVKLLVLGSGDIAYLESLKTLCMDFDISHNVIFQPWVSRVELPSIFDASDISVWPGGASISMVEAASVGLPLVVMRSPVEAYALSNQNGFFYNPGDIKEIHRLIEMLVCDEDMRLDMGRRSRQLVEKKLNWRSIALDYVDLYNSSLE